MQEPQDTRSVGPVQRLGALPGWLLWLMVLGYGIVAYLLLDVVAQGCWTDSSGCAVPALITSILFIVLPLAAGLALANAVGIRAEVTRWALILGAIELALLAITAIVPDSVGGGLLILALIALIVAPVIASAQMSMRKPRPGLSATVALVETALGGAGGILFVFAVVAFNGDPTTGGLAAVAFGSAIGGFYAAIGGLIGAPIGVGIGRLIRDRRDRTAQSA